MNVDHILQTANTHGVDYLLIGGMNFLLRHSPILTFDVDLWIEDSQDNRARCEAFLAALSCEWGAGNDDWGPVRNRQAGWLLRQSIYCLTSPHGAIDIFRQVCGLSSWQECRQRAVNEATANGVSYFGLADQDMLLCQLALAESERKSDRIATLEKVLRGSGQT